MQTEKGLENEEGWPSRMAGHGWLRINAADERRA